MQTIESHKNSYGSKRNITIIFCVIWLVLGALILEWLPLIPANYTSVPDNYVTLDVSSNSLKTRGESGNIHRVSQIIGTGHINRCRCLPLGKQALQHRRRDGAGKVGGTVLGKKPCDIEIEQSGSAQKGLVRIAPGGDARTRDPLPAGVQKRQIQHGSNALR